MRPMCSALRIFLNVLLICWVCWKRRGSSKRRRWCGRWSSWPISYWNWPTRRSWSTSSARRSSTAFTPWLSTNLVNSWQSAALPKLSRHCWTSSAPGSKTATSRNNNSRSHWTSPLLKYYTRRIHWWSTTLEITIYKMSTLYICCGWPWWGTTRQSNSRWIISWITWRKLHSWMLACRSCSRTCLTLC